jgi:hypothetical protein
VAQKNVLPFGPKKKSKIRTTREKVVFVHNGRVQSIEIIHFFLRFDKCQRLHFCCPRFGGLKFVGGLVKLIFFETFIALIANHQAFFLVNL